MWRILNRRGQASAAMTSPPRGVPRKGCRGLTLLELMITLVLVTTLVGSVYLLYSAGFRSFYDQELRTGLKGATDRGVNRLAVELRQAVSLLTAQSASLSFTLDTDDDGDEDTVTYSWSGTAGNPLNRVADATTPLVGSVSGLAFSYYDAAGALLSSPVAVSQVRSVGVNLTVSDGDESFVLRLQTRLRNLS